MKNFTVLVVDDSATVRAYHQMCLQKIGVTVLAAFNGQEALEILLDNPADLVLLDINMPVMDGYATLEALRGRYENDVPVMMVSTESEYMDSERALTYGANYYAVKPAKEAELIELVKLMAGVEEE